MILARFLHRVVNKTKRIFKMKAEEKEEEKIEQETPKMESETAETEASKPEAEQKEEVDPVAELQAKLAEQKDLYMRLLAEFDNYKKRTLKEKSDLLKYGGESIIKNLLPVIDDLDRAVEHLPEEDSPIKEGVVLILKKFQSFLDQNNVKVIETKDAEFNTDFHEAATLFPAASEDQKNKVIDCIQKGYTYNDKVIRYAKVVVAQ